MGDILIWWLVVLILGLATFPITFVALKYFPDKGYVFSKVLALLLMGYLYWILGYLAFNGATLLLSFLIVAAVSAVLLLTWIGRPFFEFFKKNIGFFLLMESFFLTAFLMAGAYKMRTYDIVGTEKPMDFSFINGILASPSMPPQDPWLSGGSISYYYFGYLIVAMLCKISSVFSVTSGEGFNLAIALTWSLAATCAFSLGYALTRRYRYSLFSAVCLVVFGNLDFWHRAIQSFLIGDLGIPYYNRPPNPGAQTGLGAFLGFIFSPLEHGWDYFQASRIIPVPPSDKMINEFPAFSFFLSDLHPHVMGIPFVLLAMAFSFNLLKSTPIGLQIFSGTWPWKITQWILWPVIFGGLSFMNVADFPTFLFLLGVCLFLQQWWAIGQDGVVWFKSVATVGIPVVFLAFLFYMPFYLRYQSQVQGLGLVTGDRTDIYYLFVIFGFFLVILFPVLIRRASLLNKDKSSSKSKVKRSDSLKCVICGKESSNKNFCGYCGGELAVESESDIISIPGEKIRKSLAQASYWLSPGANSQRGWMVLGLITLVVLLLNVNDLSLGSLSIPLKFGTLLFSLLFVFYCLASLAAKNENRESVFVLLLALIGFMLIAGCEVVYVKDLFTGALFRMNSVFKFHYHVWILFSIAAGPLLKWLVDNQWPQWASWKKALWFSVAFFVLIGAALYPILAFTARMRGSSPDTVTMDGESYYEHTFPTDYAIAQWIKQNVTPVGKKVPVILEAWGGSYHQECATLATMTGYPTILGWDFHEVQWHGTWDKAVIRGGDPQDTVFQRRTDVDTIYTSADINQTRDLLRKYSVDYVYVGDVEREKYKEHPENLNKFSQLGTVVQQVGSSVLYKINP
jgi:YYY domain-containing protein